MTLAIDRTQLETRETPRTHAIPAVAGASLRVPLVTGGDIGYANLDHAASAPCLDAVRAKVDEFLPWYASVHRGAGFASQVSTKLYERTRDVLRRFVDARRTDTVVFTRNTTDAFNQLCCRGRARTSGGCRPRGPASPRCPLWTKRSRTPRRDRGWSSSPERPM